MSPASVARTIDRLVGAIGWAVAWLALAMVLTDVAVVTMRYGFSTVFTWLQELMMYFHAALFLTGAVYIIGSDGHVRVNILYNRFPPPARTWVDLATMLIVTVPLSILLFWTSYDFVLNSWKMLERSSHSGGLDAVFVLKTFIWVFAALLLLAAIARMLHCIAELLGQEQRGDQTATPDTEVGM